MKLKNKLHQFKGGKFEKRRKLLRASWIIPIITLQNNRLAYPQNPQIIMPPFQVNGDRPKFALPEYPPASRRPYHPISDTIGETLDLGKIAILNGRNILSAAESGDPKNVVDAFCDAIADPRLSISKIRDQISIYG